MLVSFSVTSKKSPKSIKVVQNDLTRKIKDFHTFTKLGKLIVAKVFEKLPKVQSGHTGFLPSSISFLITLFCVILQLMSAYLQSLVGYLLAP